MVQKYESPVRIYKYPFELVVARRHGVSLDLIVARMYRETFDTHLPPTGALVDLVKREAALLHSLPVFELLGVYRHENERKCQSSKRFHDALVANHKPTAKMFPMCAHAFALQKILFPLDLCMEEVHSQSLTRQTRFDHPTPNECR
uniref:Uncharacterized protein n=1 Tax=Anopheles atroparvus TaxID=41427 RepID=A0AAG5DI43_ANOAO